MKVIFLFITMCLGISFTAAQVVRIDTVTYPTPTIPKTAKNNFNTNYGYTLAIRAYSYEQFPQVLEQADQQFLSSYFNGILFKFNDNQIGYRLQANYFDRNISFDNRCQGCALADGRLQNTAVKVGMEKSVNYSRIQPYLGADVGFMIQKFRGNSVNYATAEQVFTEDNKNALLFSPLVGLKLYLIPQVAIGAEANFNIAYTYQKTNAFADESRSGAPSQTKRYRWEYFFAPVAAISLQYSFGLINQ